jgi:Zn-finger nucleic acid-binding protein
MTLQRAFAEQKECPDCHGNWDGGDIYEALKAMYPEKSDDKIRELAASQGWSEMTPVHYSELIWVTGNSDRVIYWQCPHCHQRWDRMTLNKLGVAA